MELCKKNTVKAAAQSWYVLEIKVECDLLKMLKPVKSYLALSNGLLYYYWSSHSSSWSCYGYIFHNTTTMTFTSKYLITNCSIYMYILQLYHIHFSCLLTFYHKRPYNLLLTLCEGKIWNHISNNITLQSAQWKPQGSEERESKGSRGDGNHHGDGGRGIGQACDRRMQIPSVDHVSRMDFIILKGIEQQSIVLRLAWIDGI